MHSYSAISRLIDADNVLLDYRIGEKRPATIDGQSDFYPMRMEMEVPNQTSESRSDVWRVFRHKAYYS